MKLLPVSLLIFLVSLGPFVRAQTNDDPKVRARAALERIEALRKERPGDGILVFYQALVHTTLGEREAVFELLRSLKGRRLGLIPVRAVGFESIWDDPAFQKIRQELAEEEVRTADAPVAFRLKEERLIPEGIAYDAKRGRFFIGSIAQRKIVVSDGKGEVRDFSASADKLGPVLGLAVDAAGGHLYAISTNGFLDEAKKARRNEIVRYELETGRLLDRFAAPAAEQLNDLVLAADGTIYATDSAGGTLFRKKAEEKELKALGAAGVLRGANGIALDKEGALYVAISTGIARVDLETGEPTRLPQPDTVVTGGCDGLYWHDGYLLGIQNSTNPGRVIRMDLAKDRTRIAGVTVLQSHHHPELNEPTTGTVARGALHVIANSYVEHYRPDGTIKNPDKLNPTAILAVPL